MLNLRKWFRHYRSCQIWVILVNSAVQDIIMQYQLALLMFIVILINYSLVKLAMDVPVIILLVFMNSLNIAFLLVLFSKGALFPKISQETLDEKKAEIRT